jgi:hypothetical protein
VLLKDSLNRDGQQCHQYQQYKQLPLTFTHWTQKKGTTVIDIGNPGLGLEQAHKCGRVKPVNWISNDNIYINKQ